MKAICRYRLRSLCAALGVGLFLVSSSQAQSNLYFLRDDGNTQNVLRSASTGLNQVVLATSSGYTALVLDPIVPQIFVVQDGSISVVDSKGPRPQLESVNANLGLAFDPPSRTLFYLGGSRSSTIFSWNIVPKSDGRLNNPVENYQISQTSTPKYLAWDGSKYLYWSETELSGRKQRSSIKRIQPSSTASFPEEFVYGQDDSFVGETAISSLAYSQATGLLYLCQRGTNFSRIQRLNPALSEPQPLTLVNFDKTCSGIAVDDRSGLLYVSFDSSGDAGIVAVNQTEGSTVTTIDPQAKMLGIGVEPLRPVSPQLAPAAPVLEVVDRSVTILMEKFIFRQPAKALRSTAAVVASARKKPKVEYVIRVSGNGKNLVRRSKTNKFTLRGLKSGSYTTKYRVRYTDGKRERATKFSPEQAFTIV